MDLKDFFGTVTFDMVNHYFLDKKTTLVTRKN